MKSVEIAPGLWTWEMSDEERRERYSLANSDEIINTLYSERDAARLKRTDTGFKAKLRTVGEHILFGPPQIRPDVDIQQFQQLVEQSLENVAQQYHDSSQTQGVE